MSRTSWEERLWVVTVLPCIHVHAQMSHRGSAAWEDSAAESRGGLRLCATTWFGVGDR